MPYPRGYRIYEPLNSQIRDPAFDRLVKVLVENDSGTISGAEYYDPLATTITWTEDTSTSTYLTAGAREYRYIVPFDDENDGTPSPIFSVLNLVPPTDLVLTSMDYDTVKINFTNVDGASEYTVRFRKLLNSAITEQVISNNEYVIGLEPNTGYEVSIKATNSSSDSTDYSIANPAYVTLKYFALTNTVSSRGIVWDIDYDLDGNTAYFEIVKETGELVADLGTDSILSQSNVNVGTYRYLARLHNYDATMRETRISEATVYHDAIFNNAYSDGIYTEDKFKEIADENLFHPYKDIFEYEDSIYVDNQNNHLLYEQPWKDWTIENVGFLDEALFSFGKFQNATETSVTNENIVDKFRFNHGSYNDYQQINHATRTDITNNYNYITYTDFSNYNLYKNNLPYESVFASQELKKIFPVDESIVSDSKSTFSLENLNYTQAKDSIKHLSSFSQDFVDYSKMSNDIYTDNLKVFSYQNDIGKDFKYLLDGLKIGIGNEHIKGITPPRFVYSNDYNLPLTRVRDALYNPIIPKDINNKDIVWNQINKDINLVSQVNRVRILCVGDSITAG